MLPKEKKEDEGRGSGLAIALGVIFGLLAVIVIGLVGYHLYKKA